MSRSNSQDYSSASHNRAGCPYLNQSGLGNIGGWIHTNLGITIDVPQYSFLIYGIIILVVMLFRTEGLIPSSRRKQELHRGVGTFASFAAGFSFVSILTTVDQFFFIGFGFGGAAFFWTWPVVFIGQLLVAYNFATLAARYPISGAVQDGCEWARSSRSSRSLSWLSESSRLLAPSGV